MIRAIFKGFGWGCCIHFQFKRDPMIIPFDQFGKLIKPVSRPCSKKHTGGTKFHCVDCNPCYCDPAIRRGRLFDCKTCIGALGGPEKASELLVAHTFCKHFRQKYVCLDCDREKRATGKKTGFFFCQHSTQKTRCTTCRDESIAKGQPISSFFCEKHFAVRTQCTQCRDENLAAGLPISPYFCPKHFVCRKTCLQCRMEREGAAAPAMNTRCPHELPLTYSCKACRSQWGDGATPDLFWPGCEVYFKRKAAQEQEVDGSKKQKRQ